VNIRTTAFVIIGLTLLFLAVSAAAAGYLPERVAIHWDAMGQANGYSSRAFSVAFLPLFAGGLSLLILFLPSIDPLKANVALFRKEYNWIAVILMLFMGYIHFLSLAWNLGWKVEMIRAMVPAFAVLCYFLGYLLGKARRNFFIGIRTPWTLSSDTVWEKTHKTAGLWYKAAALVSLVGLFVPGFSAFLFLVGPLTLVSLGAVVYSYLLYRQEQSGTPR
jgi:uncharacterized membrane protein